MKIGKMMLLISILGGFLGYWSAELLKPHLTEDKDDNAYYLAQCGPNRFNGTVEKKSGKFYTLDGKPVWIPYKECSIVLIDKVKVSVVQPE